jgi:DNA mismatch endonuclease (patch repair protein)
MMSGIRGRDTKPEIALRKALFAKGFRYRVNVRSLAGRPDLVFARRQAVVFVHGCFWHGHDCPLFRLPDTRREFWSAKINGNRQRDERIFQTLRDADWRICTVWECSVRGTCRLGMNSVAELVAAWLDGEESALTIRGRTPDDANS